MSHLIGFSLFVLITWFVLVIVTVTQYYDLTNENTEDVSDLINDRFSTFMLYVAVAGLLAGIILYFTNH